MFDGLTLLTTFDGFRNFSFRIEDNQTNQQRVGSNYTKYDTEKHMAFDQSQASKVRVKLTCCSLYAGLNDEFAHLLGLN
ncbi:hypothetical protein L1987_23578 [Smallanthus sonchifolius]|uniref:Uncharacterized protein n=1 Tax=Smallanthus sonchifolius TaxID=185202 RepID=A0ACB9II34_9ASTR|nr:hypothetical protein L1987_23578 [Smallanthus sonchifolius]